jgi:hypothetical protein
MPAFDFKFIHANVLRAAELRIPIKIMLSESLAETMEAWKPFLRIDSISLQLRYNSVQFHVHVMTVIMCR